MAGDTVITVVGNLTDDPELRFTSSGAAVANFTVASTPRFFDKQTNDWKDGDALFLRCSIWRQAAENVAESLTKGARVIVQGRLKQRSYETREGEKRTVYELDVDEVGPSLRYATAKVSKVSRRRERRWRIRWPVAPGGPRLRPKTRGRCSGSRRRAPVLARTLTSTTPSPLRRGPELTGAPRWPSPRCANRRRRSASSAGKTPR